MVISLEHLKRVLQIPCPGAAGVPSLPAPQTHRSIHTGIDVVISKNAQDTKVLEKII